MNKKNRFFYIRAIFFLYLSLLLRSSGEEQIYPLTDSSYSPNRQYRFVLAKIGEKGKEILSYGLVRNSNDKGLWTTPSSYNLSLASDKDWALKMAQGVKVYWNADSTQFVLDETHYHFSGSTILGTISEENRTVTNHVFVPLDLQLSNLAQWSIQINEGWIDSKHLSLKLTGMSGTTSSSPGNQFTENFICETANLKFFQEEK